MESTLYTALSDIVQNIERWQETGIPASPEESKALYDNAKAALAEYESAQAKSKNDFPDDYAKKLLEKYARRNMVHWNHFSFKTTHSRLYKAIIEAIIEALNYEKKSESDAEITLRYLSE